MPNHLRFMLSIVVAVVGLIAYYFEARAGAETMKWVMLGLAAFMIFAVWLFPEPKRDKGGRG